MYPCLETRRSIRSYRDQPVEEDKLERIASAAALAPSAHHGTPWHLTIVCNPAAKRCLAEAMGRAWDGDMAHDGVPAGERATRVARSVRRFSSAPALILVSLVQSRLPRLAGKLAECEEIMAIQSVAATIFALLLAAGYEGLGAAWHCAPLFCPDAVREAIGLEQDVWPQALLTVGYPAAEPGPRPPRALDTSLRFIR